MLMEVLRLGAVAVALLTLVGCSADPLDPYVGGVRPGSTSGSRPSVLHPTTSASPSATTERCQPHARLNPSSGPVGTTIRVTGGCFGAIRRYDGASPSVFLLHEFARPRECEIRIGGQQSVRIAPDGSLEGSFVVSARGGCAQHPYFRRATPATYVLGVGCVACTVTSATFRLQGP